MLSLPFSAPLLAIEASTTAGSVAVWRDGTLVGYESVRMGAGEDDSLFPAVLRALHGAQLSPRDLKAVVCGGGPGSFTSLRIAAALAKGIAHGSGAALYAVPSLLVAAASFEPFPTGAPGEGFVVHADAMRGERYALPVRRDAHGRLAPAGSLARIAAAGLVEAIPPQQRVAVLTSPWSDELPPITPHVRHLLRAGGEWREQPVSLETWEPEYGRLAEAQVKWEERFGMALPETPAIRA